MINKINNLITRKTKSWKESLKMHYLVNNIVVKSENAALSTKQTNKIVLKYIDNLPDNIKILDYGCGKCRYSLELQKKACHLTLLDSQVQISRTQTIHSDKTTVELFANKNMKNTSVYSIEKFDFTKQQFDFILCSNVLSAIPDKKERKILLDNIHDILLDNGTALITIQYRNSYFSTYNNREGVQKYEDGWLIKRNNSYSFYGIIYPEQLIEMCLKSNLKIKNINKNDGSIYLTVTRKS